MSLDFIDIKVTTKKDKIVIYPDFKVVESKDLIVRNGDFVAIYDEDTGLWDTNEMSVAGRVDCMTFEYKDQSKYKDDPNVVVMTMRSNQSGLWSNYISYRKNISTQESACIDKTVTYVNESTKREDYKTKRLSYALSSRSNHKAWDEIIETLYDPSEREKIEWFIGSIAAKESYLIDKFMVFYGPPGSGKSTIINVMSWMLDGYCMTVNANALGKSQDAFSTGVFESNPILGIQHDCDLSRIDDNTILNSIVSHEPIIINQKYKKGYSKEIFTLMVLGTNEPVKITSDNSGICRRLLDVVPSGRLISPSRYDELLNQVKFEYGSIMSKCKKVYQERGRKYYRNYIPKNMVESTDIFFNFVIDVSTILDDGDGITLKQAWDTYKQYCEDANIRYPLQRFQFKKALKSYFREYYDRIRINGKDFRCLFKGLKTEKLLGLGVDSFNAEKRYLRASEWLSMTSETSELDIMLKDQPAQYASESGTPIKKWIDVKTVLSDLDTKKLHYVKVPENHIIIDFDIKNEKGEKDRELNIDAASSWPETYAELSKSGNGIHLHYIYDGDPSQLSYLFSEGVEVKVFKGNGSLRRKLSFCNNHKISHICSGLPLKEKSAVINHEAVKSEKLLRNLIKRAMGKEFGATKPSIDFIDHVLKEAYEAGTKYDISDMTNALVSFANSSTNRSSYCLQKVLEMKLRSDEPAKEISEGYADDRMVFYDIEVFPNLFLVNWKYAGESNVVRMINPSAKDISKLLEYKLVGFNNLRYDNHLLYARYIGYTNEQLYELSKAIIHNNGRGHTFGEAYGISYTDVYDFLSAGNKMSLKKWEIKLGIHHKELGYSWDEPVPEDEWDKVAEYCDNDVIATEAVFDANQGDWKAREMLAALAKMTPNTTTNHLTEAVIFQGNKHPRLIYTDLKTGKQYESNGEEVSESKYKNAWPEYEYKDGKNLYKGIDVGRGGYVRAKPGMYGKTLTLDVESMHPHSIIAMKMFGEYTDRFEDIVNARALIKHKKYDEAKKVLNGELAPYLDNPSDMDALSKALKTAVNSVYGLTSAGFPNTFKDPRNVNNIVALRGALFMAMLADEVEEKGYTVIHVKTDSIKIPDADSEIEEYCQNRAKEYGYKFDVEAKWDRICLVNNAVFIGHQTDDSPQKPNQWTATGAQFAHPVVFKSLFSKEKLDIDDYGETREVKAPASIYLSVGKEDEPDYKFVGRVGRFIPVTKGGGIMFRHVIGTDKYSSVSNTKNYRWEEFEEVDKDAFDNVVDHKYYKELIDNAKSTIEKFGSFEQFVDLQQPLNNQQEIPWMTPCGRTDIDCEGCSKFVKDHELCSVGYDISDVMVSKKGSK